MPSLADDIKRYVLKTKISASKYGQPSHSKDNLFT